MSASQIRRSTSRLLSRKKFSSVVGFLSQEVVGPMGPLIRDREHAESRVYPKSYKEVPGPRKLPFIGNSWRFAPFIGEYKIHELDKLMLSLHEEYGDVVKVSGLIGHPDLLFVFDGDEIERVFRREEGLPHRPSMPSLHQYKQVLRKDFFGETAGVIGVHGVRWDNFRAQVQQVMLQPSTARKFVGPLDEIATDFMHRIHNMKDENNELPGNFLGELYKWALESIGRVALDTRLGCLDADQQAGSESHRIIDSINTFFWNVAEVELRVPLWRIFPTPSYKKYIGALDDFRELCMKHITIAMEKMEKSEIKNKDDISIVHRILEQSGDPKLAAVLALDLLLVGVDTTSVAMTTTIYQLSKNPRAQNKLRTELQEAMASPEQAVDAACLDRLPYLKACVKEALRMYPVILGNGRSLTSEAVIGGYTVPKGTHIIFPHYVVSNESKYFPEPEKFLPERWLKTTTSKNDLEAKGCPEGCPYHGGSKIHPFVSLPFGYGRRTCLGKRFAEAEMQILLAKIFRKYDVQYHYGELTYKVTPTYLPNEPLKFRLTELVELEGTALTARL